MTTWATPSLHRSRNRLLDAFLGLRGLGRPALALVDEEKCEERDDGTEGGCDAKPRHGVVSGVVLRPGRLGRQGGRGVEHAAAVVQVRRRRRAGRQRRARHRRRHRGRRERTARFVVADVRPVGATRAVHRGTKSRWLWLLVSS